MFNDRRRRKHRGACVSHSDEDSDSLPLNDVYNENLRRETNNHSRPFFLTVTGQFLTAQVLRLEFSLQTPL